ncbi:iron ABC transporter permease [Oceanobacillus piezotolerans]|uniref:Iron ABC transporter permease n=1 Tax=Oceanobacillus piezotolerans TaxID=2448030 RepID=A0A498D995_9BACI|nr:iron ABC transporter permease [Oceanobacillus piezotolerans]RLL46983.1 iron ABC transporter permease [Oceanobacillus piezotolerans]
MNTLKSNWYRINPITVILSFFIVWFVFAFLIYPNVNTIYETFFGTGTFSLEPVEKLLRSDRAIGSILNSILLAFILVVTVNLVGVSLVLFTNYFDIKGANVLKISYFSTLVYGGVALNLGYKLVYGENGPITQFLLQLNPHWNDSWFSGLFAVAFVMTFACTSNHMLFLSSAMRSIDYQTIEAAKNLGASQFTILTKVVLPTLKPTLFALTILTFLTGLSATSAPLVFGGREFETITPMILTFANSSSSKDLATVLALVLGIVTIIVLTFMIRSEEKGNYISISKTKTSIVKQKINNKGLNVLVHIIAYVLFVIYSMPVLAIIIYSFTDSLAISSGMISLDSFTIDNYLLTFSSIEAIRPYLISLVYGFLGSFIVVAFCLLCAYLMKIHNNLLTRTLDYSLMIPWFLPSTLIAVGLSVTFNTGQWVVFNQVFTGTLWLLLFGYIIVHIPFTLRISKSAFFGVNQEVEDAAKNLGANAFYTFIKVILPIIMPTILGIFSLNFIGILPDYDLTVFLYHPLFEPLGITIMNATGNSASADTKALNLVYTVILMILNTLILTTVYGNWRFIRKRKRG